jgi:hypothetical protein
MNAGRRESAELARKRPADASFTQMSSSYNDRLFQRCVPRIIFSSRRRNFGCVRVLHSLRWENVVYMTTEYRFDDLDLREEPARLESDPDLFSDSVTTTPKTDTCSASCMTCYGARW